MKKIFRKRKYSSSDEEKDNEEADTNKLKKTLEETKERQKLRNKPNGINIIGLALGTKVSVEEECTSKDPFNTKTGGMINMQALKLGKVKPSTEDPYDVGIGTHFSAETNKRDEDEEMMKYIEEKLSKRKGKQIEDNTYDKSGKYLTPEESALMSLPDHLRHSSTKKSEEMLSNQMLNGIPEVDLGIEAKIRNIEATEEAKEKLIQEQKNKKDGPSHFVPTNMAVNFVQHNRFNIEEAELKRKKIKQTQQMHEEKSLTTQNNKKKGVKTATDDYHYDKFKKQFRRY